VYLWLKFVHVAFATMVGIGSVGGLAVASRARRSGSVREIGALMRAHHLLIVSQVIPGAVGSLATGLAIVWLAGFDLRSSWIAGTMLGWVASLAVGVGLLVPAERGAIGEVDRLTAAGEDAPSPSLRAHVGATKVWLGEWATVVLLVAMMWLMVLKPA
jgi:uncharacterized membrane protein